VDAEEGDWKVQGSVIQKKGRMFVGNDARVKEKIMKELHATSIGGHSGMQATYQRVNKKRSILLARYEAINMFFCEGVRCMPKKQKLICAWGGVITTFTDSRQGMGLYHYGFHRRIAEKDKINHRGIYRRKISQPEESISLGGS
jgi:hypothetical protein